MVKSSWQGKRAVIIGAARQGLALARYLARHGAKVVLNDRRSNEQLSAEMESLANYDIQWATGGHSIEILDPCPDLVCVSGGVPLDNPLVVFAVENNIRLSNDTQIFMDAVPCRTVGITGSAGKTTTTTLVGRMANSDTSGTYRRIWVGGNIGDPLLNYVDEMQPTDLAILEISSFQAELMSSSPNVAAILNITPNHLDRHGTMDSYIAAKTGVVRYQKNDDHAILGRDDPTAWGLAGSIRSRIFSFGCNPLPDGQNGTFIENENMFLRDDGKVSRLPLEDQIELSGEHNRQNVLAACIIAHAAGFGFQAMLSGVKGFRGVPHRLELVSTWRGAHWYNDSMATAPERTAAAVKSFTAPIILLLGGRDKDLPWDELGKLIHERVDHVILFGEAAEKIQAAIGEQKAGEKPYSLTRVQNCQSAVTAASRLAEPGFVVLFSPGGTSFDEFKDFEERGEKFRQWVLEFTETPQ